MQENIQDWLVLDEGDWIEGFEWYVPLESLNDIIYHEKHPEYSQEKNQRYCYILENISVIQCEK
jgi:hypothetical protein